MEKRLDAERSALHLGGRRTLQKRIQHPSSKVHHNGEGRLRYAGNTSRGLRLSLRSQSHGNKNTAGRILLAHHPRRLCHIRKKCLSCQKQSPKTHLHQEELHHISSPWPFSKWGMNIIKPFTPGKG